MRVKKIRGTFVLWQTINGSGTYVCTYNGYKYRYQGTLVDMSAKVRI